MIILGIETSCDETAAAVVEYDGGFVIKSNTVASQIEEQRLYGGVVPEIASRRHCENISAVTRDALDTAGVAMRDIDVVAVTAYPGLIGALLVGVNFAKGLAYAHDKPLVPVHHIHGHIAAAYTLENSPLLPFYALAVSGGHSHIISVEDFTKFTVVGCTSDDAAGECFDKAARAMGLPYPGGVSIDKTASAWCAENPNSPWARMDCKHVSTDKINLPFPKGKGKYDFSFSGLKTAVLNHVNNSRQKGIDVDVGELCAALRHTIAVYLTEKFVSAAVGAGVKNIAMVGGVAANSHIREVLAKSATDAGLMLHIPPLSLCGDNAAMIAVQGYYNFKAGAVADLSLNAKATHAI